MNQLALTPVTPTSASPGAGPSLTVPGSGGLSPTQQFVYDEVTDEPQSTREIAERAGFIRPVVAAHLNGLRDLERVIRTESGWVRR